MERVTILIAESDEEDLKRLKEALEKDGYSVVTAPDGVQALQIALQQPPSIIILALDLPMIDGVKLSQIVRTNPKTESIPIFFMNDRTVQISHFRRTTDYFIIKPFNVDELRKILGGTRKKIQSAMSMKAEEEFSGNLRQMAVPDVLQMLSLNQKTGNVYLYIDQKKGDKRTGLIAIKQGRIVNAFCDKATRIKALYRILAITEGFFSYLPGEPELTEEITQGTDSLIMEGLRQNDEYREMMRKFESDKLKLSLCLALSDIPAGLRPKTLEVLSAIEVFPLLSDLMDNVDVLDYEILRILIGLRDKGIVKIEPVPDEAEARREEFSSDILLELKKAIVKAFSGIHPPYNVSIPVFFEDHTQAAAFLKALTGFSFSARKADILRFKRGEARIGQLGELRTVESIRINIQHFTGTIPSRPFMTAFFDTAIGALLIGKKDAFKDVTGFFGKKTAVIGPKEKMEFESLSRAFNKLIDAFIVEHL